MTQGRMPVGQGHSRLTAPDLAAPPPPSVCGRSGGRTAAAAAMEREGERDSEEGRGRRGGRGRGALTWLRHPSWCPCATVSRRGLARCRATCLSDRVHHREVLGMRRRGGGGGGSYPWRQTASAEAPRRRPRSWRGQRRAIGPPNGPQYIPSLVASRSPIM